MADVVHFLTFNAPTFVWSRTTGGIISYPHTVVASAGGPFIVNPITVPFDPIHETGGAFWRLTDGPNVGFLVSAHSNSLGYGDITITESGEPTTFAEGIAKIDALAEWRLLIKDMGGETGGSSHMLTFNDDTFVWSRTTTGIIKWPHEFEHAPGGPYAVNPIVVPFDPEHETGGSFWRLTEGPFTGFLVSFWSNSLGYGDITVEDNPNFDRGPGAVLVTLGPGDVVPLPPTGRGDGDPAHLAGASVAYNAGGEMHFTLLVDSPFIDIPLPKRTHYVIEFWDKDIQEWVEPTGGFAGWIWDFDATDTEVVFYGIDYLAAFAYSIDERYDPALGIDVPAPNGSKYIDKSITEVVTSQLTYAITRPDSMVGFVALGDIAPMAEHLTIYSTFHSVLPFVTGLLDSHRAGTGKQTRVVVRKLSGVYTVMVEDDPGLDRDNLLIQYGGLAQGYRAIPFGKDWASRVNFIGRDIKGSNLMYRAESSAVDQGLWGRIAQGPAYIETVDYNDMKRRALQAAIDASRLGRQISVGLKLGSFRPMEGYDICDNLPLDINHGAVTTKDWGSDDFGVDPPDDPSGVMASFWTILGLQWESYDDGHWMTGLTLYPRGKRPLTTMGCVPPANHQFGGPASGITGFMYEISGITIDQPIVAENGTPTYDGGIAVLPTLTPGDGFAAIEIAAAAFNHDGVTPPASAYVYTGDLVEDANYFGSLESTNGPEIIIAHKIIESTSGPYDGSFVQSPSGYFAGGVTTAGIFRAIEGMTPTIVQTKVGVSASGTVTVTLDSMPQAGSILVAVLGSRDPAGGPVTPITPGWAGLDQVNSMRGVRLMWWTGCAGEGLTVPSESLVIEPPSELVVGDGPPA